MNRKSVTFTILVVLVLLVAIFGFVFRDTAPEYIQGEAEAVEVRISGKVPGRIERFMCNEGDRVKAGDTVAILDSPEVLAKYSQAEAAEDAGLQAGDRIVAVDSVPSETYDVFSKELAANKGKSVELQYVRHGKVQSTTIQISEAGKIGIMLTPITDLYKTKTIEYNLWQSIPRGIEIGVDKLVSYVSQMKYIFTSEGAKSLGGFGAIGNMFPDTWSWYQFWVITAFISLALAFMNILPIPALDGGHILFLIYEMITGREPNQKFMEYAQMIGLGLLVLLMLYANANDIYRFFIK